MPGMFAELGVNEAFNASAFGAYSGMAIRHAPAGEPFDVAPLGARLEGARTVALFKSEDLEVMRLVLLAGKALPAHKVAGEITIQCIEGRIEVTTDGQPQVLCAGQMLFLAREVVHGVVALENASALLTIALTGSAPAQHTNEPARSQR